MGNGQKIFMTMRSIKLVIVAVLLVAVVIGGLWWAISPVSGKKDMVTFVIPQRYGDFDLTGRLVDEHIIKHPMVFSFLWKYLSDGAIIRPGGYRLSSSMNVWKVVETLAAGPDFIWVTVPEGWRKEQIGEKLAAVLGWDEGKLGQWNKLYSESSEYAEGVYFPDTYLLPKDESAEEIGKRFIAHFNEVFKPLSEKFAEKNIRWTTGLKIASLIQREAAGPEDMALISGIIWNRLDKNMSLDIDATLQYIRGKAGGYWWAPISASDKNLDSPYNTYLNKGLPPTPIANPGLAAIAAALDPAETDCLYYLHDRNRQIHCSRTYQGQLDNIKKYLD